MLSGFSSRYGFETKERAKYRDEPKPKELVELIEQITNVGGTARLIAKLSELRLDGR
jgi:hypothetical protein